MIKPKSPSQNNFSYLFVFNFNFFYFIIILIVTTTNRNKIGPCQKLAMHVHVLKRTHAHALLYNSACICPSRETNML